MCYSFGWRLLLCQYETLSSKSVVFFIWKPLKYYNAWSIIIDICILLKCYNKILKFYNIYSFKVNCCISFVIITIWPLSFFNKIFIWLVWLVALCHHLRNIVIEYIYRYWFYRTWLLIGLSILTFASQFQNVGSLRRL